MISLDELFYKAEDTEESIGDLRRAISYFQKHIAQNLCEHEFYEPKIRPSENLASVNFTCKKCHKFFVAKISDYENIDMMKNELQYYKAQCKQEFGMGNQERHDYELKISELTLKAHELDKLKEKILQDEIRKMAEYSY